MNLSYNSARNISKTSKTLKEGENIYIYKKDVSQGLPDCSTIYFWESAFKSNASLDTIVTITVPLKIEQLESIFENITHYKSEVTI
jgi:hypothetical protein